MADIDREKVIKGLECCCEHIEGRDCEICPYQKTEAEEEITGVCSSELAYDGLALVKEQKSIINLLRSTMEDMLSSGVASEEVSYLLRLLNKWEQGEAYANDSV